MKNVKGIWLPDHEQHLLKFATAEGWQYQVDKFRACEPYVKNRNLAIDVGAHCGLWSSFMCKVFKEVEAFEPLEEHRACYVKNVAGQYKLHPYALGNENKKVSIHTTQGQSGDSWVTTGHDVKMKRLDEYELTPDFIKIDCEGYEYFVLQGAKETIERGRPCIIVEQKPGKATLFGLRDTQAVDFLKTLGYELRKVISGDYILSPA